MRSSRQKYFLLNSREKQLEKLARSKSLVFYQLKKLNDFTLTKRKVGSSRQDSLDLEDLKKLHKKNTKLSSIKLNKLFL